VDEQALDAGLPVPVPYLLAQGRGARFVQHLVRLDVDAPLTPAGGDRAVGLVRQRPAAAREVPDAVEDADPWVAQRGDDVARLVVRFADVHHDLDRKSTRLNSSHVAISYAVFCLKKKK